MLRKKILLVDDDQLVLYGLTKALQNEAIDVMAVGTATEALEAISCCPFDLCLVDIHLPDFCGIDLMQQIKAACPAIRCIVMTASCADHQELSEKMQRVAAIIGCHFLPKPFELTQMRDLVITTLQEGTGSDHQCDMIASEMLRSRRRAERQPYHAHLVFALKAQDNDDFVGPLLVAKGIDLSPGGIGILCDAHLCIDDTLTFPDIPAQRTGAVVWSRKAANGQCQAGIQFA